MCCDEHRISSVTVSPICFSFSTVVAVKEEAGGASVSVSKLCEAALLIKCCFNVVCVFCRVKLHEAHSDLQKKREVIDDLEPPVDSNSEWTQTHMTSSRSKVTLINSSQTLSYTTLQSCLVLWKHLSYWVMKFCLCVSVSGKEDRWAAGDPEEEGWRYETNGGEIQEIRGQSSHCQFDFVYSGCRKIIYIYTHR